jgi:hypothetical protein
MESFDVNDRQQATQSNAVGTTSKNQRAMKVFAATIFGAFVIGGTCAFAGMKAFGTPAGHQDQCIDWSEEAGPEAPSIVSEFELGLDAVIEFFPENAKKILESKDEIINHMVDITDPPPESELRTLEVMPKQSKTKFVQDLGITESGGVDWEWRRLGAVAKTPSAASATTSGAHPPQNCTEALADFMHASLQFVAGFVRTSIPAKIAFRVALVRKIRLLNDAQYLDLLQEFMAWFDAQGTKRKVKALWTMMKSSWKTFVKFVFEWMAEHMKDPWETMKQMVRLASQFVVWFKKDSPQAFAAAVGLQYFAAHDMFETGKVALLSCNTTMSDLIPKWTANISMEQTAAKEFLQERHEILK